jgi:conjugal transfer pilus assembly protein TraW
MFTGCHKWRLGALLLCLCFAAQARHVGRDGPTFPIAEEDVRVFLQRLMQQKVDNGEFAREVDRTRKMLEDQYDSPRPVEGLMRTVTPRTYYFDPTYTLPQHILDADGKVLVAAGTKVNPAQHVPLRRHMLFFDARDPMQVTQAQRVLAQRKDAGIMLILVGGSLKDLRERLNVHLYFDQAGYLSRGWGIKQVPAYVRQDGNRLRIDEMNPMQEVQP